MAQRQILLTQTCIPAERKNKTTAKVTKNFFYQHQKKNRGANTNAKTNTIPLQSAACWPLRRWRKTLRGSGMACATEPRDGLQEPGSVPKWKDKNKKINWWKIYNILSSKGKFTDLTCVYLHHPVLVSLKCISKVENIWIFWKRRLKIWATLWKGKPNNSPTSGKAWGCQEFHWLFLDSPSFCLCEARKCKQGWTLILV